MKKRILKVGVMGPGESARTIDMILAKYLGVLIAEQEWILLSGGGSNGVMGEVNNGYKFKGGKLSIGISPFEGYEMSDNVDLIISTNMRSGRNYINALSCDVLIAIGNLSSAGTLSEVALRLTKSKSGKKDTFPVILLGEGPIVEALVKFYGDRVLHVTSADMAIAEILKLLESDFSRI